MNFIENNNSAPKRNEEEIRALQESGAHIARARFDSIPDASEFKGRLKAKLLEQRELKRTSMWEKIKSGAEALIPRQRHFVAGIAVFLLVAVVTSIFVTQGGQPNNKFANLFIDPVYAQDNFEVIATEGDSHAIESTTQFIVKSKTPIQKEILEKNITLKPAVEFELQEISNQEFRIIPKASLENKKVYNVKIESSYLDKNNVEVERDYSFAFQVKDDFRVVSSIPGPTSHQVPLTSGIEIHFSSPNFSDYEKAFSIEPKVEGRFQVNKNTLVFIPKKLEPLTIYTVKISKDLVVKEGNPLKEDYILRFETQALTEIDDTSKSFSISENMVEFAPGQPVVIPAYTYNGYGEVVTGIDTSVYRFDSSDQFLSEYKKIDGIPFWAYGTRKATFVDTTKLKKQANASIDLQKYHNNYASYLVLPFDLSPGFYLVEAQKDGLRYQVFLQVTDLSTFLTHTNTKTLVWVNNVKTGKPENGVEVQVLGQDAKGTTSQGGTITFDSALFRPDEKAETNYLSNYLLLTKGRDQLVVPFNGEKPNTSLDTNYWIFTSLDRSVYKPQDKVQFWGNVTPKKDAPAFTEITAIVDTYSSSRYEMVILSQQKVQLSKDGFFKGEISVDSFLPGYYSVRFVAGDETIISEGFEVLPYVKPPYSLSLSTEKKAIFLGEDTNVTVKANFFEGTPVPELEFSYDGGGQDSGIVSTEGNGEKQFILHTKKSEKSDCALENQSCWFNSYRQIQVVPTQAEESNFVYAATRLQVFPAHIDGGFEVMRPNKETAVVSTTMFALNLEVLNNDDREDDNKLFAAPAAGKKITGRIEETRYVKKETGEFYDFINKQVQKTYTYEEVKTEVGRFDGMTDDTGHFEYPFTTLKDRNYSVRMDIQDGDGNTLNLSQFVYTYYQDQYDNGYKWYSIQEPEKHPVGGYTIGETVNVEMHENSAKLEDTDRGSFLFYTMQNGLQKFSVESKPSYQFTFDESFIPNVYVGGAYFDGKKYNIVQSHLPISFNIEERFLTVETSVDKKSYEPGEKMTLNISAKDKNGKKVNGMLGISMIDEAYYSLPGAMAAESPIFDLYKPILAGELKTVYTHRYAELQDFGGAEGGGCFLAGTKIRLASGQVKNIEDIVVGDEVVTFKSEYARETVTGKVLATQKHIVNGYFVINHHLKVTGEHRIFASGAWKTVADVQLGEVLRREDGTLEEVKSIERHPGRVSVFNFEVEKYHTYLADGYYVHNDKGGGVRKVFPDVALFDVVALENGNASVNLTLPDSITSWRVNAQVIGEKNFAGVQTKDIPVTKPLFVVSSVPKELIVGDAPTYLFRAYGNGLKANDKVGLEVKLPMEEKSQKQTVSAFSPASFIGKTFTEDGEYKLQYSGVVNKLTDRVEENIVVHSSRLTYKDQKFYKATELPQALPSNPAGITELVFTNEGAGKLYSWILNLDCNCGNRFDQRIGKSVASDLLHQYFGEKETSELPDFSLYQDPSNGGIKLLPYSSSDLMLSAKAAALAPAGIDKARLADYLYAQLSEENPTKETVAWALFGLSGLEEPILPTIKNYLTTPELTEKQRVLGLLALAQIGDTEEARKVYRVIRHDVATEPTEGVMKAKFGANSDEVIENTGLLASLTAVLNEPDVDAFAAFLFNEPTQKVLVNLEELIYLKARIAHVSSAPAQGTVVIQGREETVKIEKNQTKVFHLSPSVAPTFALKNIQGPLGVLVITEKSLTQKQTQNVKDLSIDRKYFVGGTETTDFEEGNMVEVRIYPKIGEAALSGAYDIVDALPTGLKFVGNSFHPYFSYYDPSYGLCDSYAINEGQLVKFVIDKNWRQNCKGPDYISYRARVSAVGTFRQEGSVIQSVDKPGYMSFGPGDGTVTVKKK